MQNEHFTATVFPKHSSGHEDLAEQMQSGATTSAALRAEEPHIEWQQASPAAVRCQRGLHTHLRCLSPVLIVLDVQRWPLSVHLYLSPVCCLPVKSVGKLLFLAAAQSDPRYSCAALSVLQICGSPGQ